MSAGALVATTPTTSSFVLRIGGRVYTRSAPVAWPGDDGQVGSCTISETSEGSPSQMTFTIEDASGTLSFDYGEQTELIDYRSGTGRILFGGHLVETSSRRRGGGRGAILTCTALGYDAWLDWRVVGSPHPRWSSRTNRNGRITKITSDRAMVQQIINRYTDLEAPASTVDETNNAMDVVSCNKMTVRECLERIAETAAAYPTSLKRSFYVDHNKRLHYHAGSEGLTAPYLVGDGSYTRTVLDTAGLVSLWPLREASGTTVYDARNYANGTLAGGYTQNVTGGIVNEPQMRALTLNGSTGYYTATGANLHGGDVFSFECWFKRSGLGTLQHILSTQEYDIRFDTGNFLALSAGTNYWVSSSPISDTSSWHHLVVTKNGAARAFYLDGVEFPGGGVNGTIVASNATIYIGRVSFGGRYFNGSLQHVALYNVALSAATVLDHYNQGITVVPDDWEYTEAAFEGREAVYVSGADGKDGSGWVRNMSTRSTAFGTPGRQPERQEIIERDDSETAAKKNAYGYAFLRQNRDPVQSGRFTIVGYDGWRVGQTVYLSSVPDQLDGLTAEIKSIDTDVGFGSGVLTYDITWGRAKWSAARAVSRGRRRG